MLGDCETSYKIIMLFFFHFLQCFFLKGNGEQIVLEVLDFDDFRSNVIHRTFIDRIVINQLVQKKEECIMGYLDLLKLISHSHWNVKSITMMPTVTDSVMRTVHVGLD